MKFMNELIKYVYFTTILIHIFKNNRQRQQMK